MNLIQLKTETAALECKYCLVYVAIIIAIKRRGWQQNNRNTGTHDLEEFTQCHTMLNTED